MIKPKRKGFAELQNIDPNEISTRFSTGFQMVCRVNLTSTKNFQQVLGYGKPFQLWFVWFKLLIL